MPSNPVNRQFTVTKRGGADWGLFLRTGGDALPHPFTHHLSLDGPSPLTFKGGASRRSAVGVHSPPAPPCTGHRARPFLRPCTAAAPASRPARGPPPARATTATPSPRRRPPPRRARRPEARSHVSTRRGKVSTQRRKGSGGLFSFRALAGGAPPKAESSAGNVSVRDREAPSRAPTRASARLPPRLYRSRATGGSPRAQTNWGAVPGASRSRDRWDSLLRAGNGRTSNVRSPVGCVPVTRAGSVRTSLRGPSPLSHPCHPPKWGPILTVFPQTWETLPAGSAPTERETRTYSFLLRTVKSETSCGTSTADLAKLY